MRLTLREVLQATGGRLMSGFSQSITGVSTDTRTLNKGDLFFALRGGRFDGHDYVKVALQRGAVAAVVSRKAEGSEGLIQVADTLRALGDLASFWRRRFQIPVVAVTGSNGKTTTKEMIATLLASRYSVLKTEGNLNNLIGLPLTLFRLKATDEVAVLEMGMNARDEIRRLTEIAAPIVGVITNVGRAHLAGLRTVRGVAQAKGELLEGLPRNGLAVLNGDDPSFPWLKKRAQSPVRSFGFSPRCTIRGRAVEIDDLKGMRFEARLRGGFSPFWLKLLGRHNVSNALAAIAVGDYLGLSPLMMKKGLADFRPFPWRMEVLRFPNWVVINDGYNANPDSTIRALEFLADLPEGRRKVAILGEMLELGRFAVAGHREVGTKAGQGGVDLLIGVGRYARDLKQAAVRAGLSHVFAFATFAKAAVQLPSLLAAGDLILVKGSRGARMERVVESLRKWKG